MNRFGFYFPTGKFIIWSINEKLLPFFKTFYNNKVSDPIIIVSHLDSVPFNDFQEKKVQKIIMSTEYLSVLS